MLVQCTMYNVHTYHVSICIVICNVPLYIYCKRFFKNACLERPQEMVCLPSAMVETRLIVFNFFIYNKFQLLLLLSYFFTIKNNLNVLIFISLTANSVRLSMFFYLSVVRSCPSVCLSMVFSMSFLCVCLSICLFAGVLSNLTLTSKGLERKE